MPLLKRRRSSSAGRGGGRIGGAAAAAAGAATAAHPAKKRRGVGGAAVAAAAAAGAKGKPRADDGGGNGSGDDAPPLLRRRSSLAPGWADPARETKASRALAELVGCAEWSRELRGEFSRRYFVDLAMFLQKERRRAEVYPPRGSEFTAFRLTPFSRVRVVVIGQDPYHGEGQAHGLAFSVLPGTRTPPSLRNIYNELEQDVRGWRRPDPEHGELTKWAKEGVLLLNAVLTVESGEPNSHAKRGWQEFTDAVIGALSRRKDGIVFLLWGGFAQRKGEIIDRSRHTVIETAHPSPLSITKWRGCRAFSKCNAALRKMGKEPVDWGLPPGEAIDESDESDETASELQRKPSALQKKPSGLQRTPSKAVERKTSGLRRKLSRGQLG